MDIRNCKRCGKIYRYDGFSLCSSCRRNDEVDFKKVKEYIYDFPGANISEVHEATEVDIDKIIGFLREGRLEVAEEGNLLLECERCGVSITTGRFCDKCTSELQSELGGVVDSARSKNKNMPNRNERFRYMDKYKDRR